MQCLEKIRVHSDQPSQEHTKKSCYFNVFFSKVKEAFEYLSYLPSTTAQGLLLAVLVRQISLYIVYTK